MTDNVISGRFKVNARANKSYVIKDAKNHEDGYIVLSLKTFGDNKYSLSAVVLKYQYPDIDLKVGDVVKVTCSSRIVTPTSKFSPHIILSNIEKINGEIISEPVVQAQRQQRVLGL